MSTSRIEEMLESWNKLFQNVVDIKEDEVFGKIITTTGGLNDEQKDWFIKHMEDAHQAGIDEAWSKVNYWIKHRSTCATEFEAGDCDCGLVDTVKALQDNK